jgi:hypothetical protein
MDLRGWIVDEHAATLDRFRRSIQSVVPIERWRDAAGDGGASIAWLALHTAYHEDVAVNAVVRGEQPLMAEWRGGLGLAGVAADVGLGEAEQRELTDVLDVDRLVPYVVAVHDRTAALLADLDLRRLEDRPESTAALSAAGISQAAVPWLHSMWAGQPASWFLQWEAIGHRVNHVGEMVSVRNRLGLSPF